MTPNDSLARVMAEMRALASTAPPYDAEIKDWADRLAALIAQADAAAPQPQGRDACTTKLALLELDIDRLIGAVACNGAAGSSVAETIKRRIADARREEALRREEWQKQQEAARPSPEGGDAPMTVQQIEQWIGACNHEPARTVLREYIALRFHDAKPRSPAAEPRVPRRFGGKTKALALCPASCGCLWVNNGDGSMSLFSVNNKSCDECEHLPWDQLIPLRMAAKPSSEAGENT